MRISSKKPFYKRKKIIAIFLIITVLIAGGATFAIKNTSNNSSQLPEKTKPEREKKEEKRGQEPIASDNEQEKEAVRADSSANINSDTIEAPNITRAQQVDGFIRVSAIFNNPSSGTCILRFEQSGQRSVQKEAPVVVGPSYYSCNGFRVPAAELPSKGKWNIIVIHEQNGKSAHSNKEIDVR